MVVVVVGCLVVVVGELVVEVVVEVVPVPPENTPPTLVLFAGVGPPRTTALNGLPTANSTTVTTDSDKTKTSAITARIGHRTPRGPALAGGAAGGCAAIAGPSRLQSEAASTGASSTGGATPGDGGGIGGAPDGCSPTISLTFWWPASREWNANADVIVAAADPRATPMIVPPTPRKESASAAMTAPDTEAMICLTLSFMRAASRPHQWKSEASLVLSR